MLSYIRNINTDVLAQNAKYTSKGSQQMAGSCSFPYYSESLEWRRGLETPHWLDVALRCPLAPCI